MAWVHPCETALMAFIERSSHLRTKSISGVMVPVSSNCGRVSERPQQWWSTTSTPLGSRLAGGTRCVRSDFARCSHASRRNTNLPRTAGRSEAARSPRPGRRLHYSAKRSPARKPSAAACSSSPSPRCRSLKPHRQRRHGTTTRRSGHGYRQSGRSRFCLPASVATTLPRRRLAARHFRQD